MSKYESRQMARINALLRAVGGGTVWVLCPDDDHAAVEYRRYADLAAAMGVDMPDNLKFKVKTARLVSLQPNKWWDIIWQDMRSNPFLPA